VLLLFFVLVGIVVFYVVHNIKSERRRLEEWKNRSWELPDLGIQPHGEEVDRDLRELVRRLEQALPESYEERVKRRVMEKLGIGETEWGNRWFELKRFFVLTAILKGVPMYSPDVDDVWHEMLLFTREYERFSNDFLGTYLHHNPHDQPVFDPGERAWFDWMYTLLFRPTPYSRYVWGPFFRHPLSRDLLKELETSPEEQLMERHFNRESAARFEEVERLCRFVIGAFRRTIGEARRYAEQYGQRLGSHVLSLKSRETEPALWMLGVMAFLSLYYHDDFLQMQQELLKRASESGSFGGGSGNVAYCATGGVWEGSDSGSGDADGDSSCGGGVCGGGGDGGGGCGGGS